MSGQSKSSGPLGDHIEDAAKATVNQLYNAYPLIHGLSEEEREGMEKKLVRKIDLRLLIILVVMYVLNYLDRNNIATARLAGMEEELSLRGDQYQTAVSILFVGYLFMQVPSNILLNKLGKPSLYLPTSMVIWGAISTATGATQSYAGLVVCRFLLGFVEAAYFPGCLYLLSSWYTRKELGKRTALLYAGSMLSGAFGGLIAAGITNGLDYARGIRAWRWLFIIEGAITVAVAVIAYFLIPDLPRTTSWLSEEEKQLAAWRLQEDIGEDDWVDREQQSVFHAAKLAVMDYKTWLLLGVIYGVSAAGTVSTFFPTVMQSLEKSNVVTLLLTAPPYLIGFATLPLNAWHSDKTGERLFHIAGPPVVAIVACVLAVTTTSFAPRYVAMCLMIPGIYSGYVVSLGYISNVLPRPASKRAAALALINCLGNVNQIYSPFLYPSSAGPRYTTAFIVNIAMCCMTIIFAVILRVLLARLNKKIAEEESEVGGQEDEGHMAPRGFRYLL